MHLKLLALSISAISLLTTVSVPIAAIANSLNLNTLNLKLANRPSEQSLPFRRIIVRVDKAKALAQPDFAIATLPSVGSLSKTTNRDPQADFFLKIKINGKPLPALEAITNNDTATFVEANPSLIVPTSLDSVPIELALMDEDEFGSVEVADINPRRSERVLKLRYFPNTGQIIGPMGSEIGYSSQPITSTGDLKQRKASLTFSISHNLP